MTSTAVIGLIVVVVVIAAGIWVVVADTGGNTSTVTITHTVPGLGTHTGPFHPHRAR